MDQVIDEALIRNKVTLREHTVVHVTMKIAQDGIGSAPEVQEKGRIPVLPDKVFRCGITLLQMYIDGPEEKRIVLYRCKLPNSPNHPSIMVNDT